MSVPPIIVAIIPARMQSSRFPGKPLAQIVDRSMLEHVYVRTSMAKIVQRTYIATCDEEIRAEAERFGATAVMTSNSHERCTDRIAEAVQSISCDIVVLVQGDEPLLHPSMIEEVAAPLIEDSTLDCCNLIVSLDPLGQELHDPHLVKVVCAQDSSVLYMSRSPIPSCQRDVSAPAAKQLGIIAFRKECLLRYPTLEPTPFERAESVDMLRLIEHGIQVRAVLSKKDSVGVDTPQQLKKVAECMVSDPIYLKYKEMKEGV